MVLRLKVKTLKGNLFEIAVQPNDTVMAVKKTIEKSQGRESFPCGQQLLIHNGKVLKDDSTLEQNKVSENGCLVVMLAKSKIANTSGTTSAQSAAVTPPRIISSKAPPQECSSVASSSTTCQREKTDNSFDVYGKAASNFVAGSNLEQTVQQLLDIGGGTWDRDTVLRAVHAAYNNPERAVEYLYTGIPLTAEVAVRVSSAPAPVHDSNRVTSVLTGENISGHHGSPQTDPAVMFPQETPSHFSRGGIGALDFLQNNAQFLQLRSMVQENPQILQPMLRELGKQNPELLRLIQEHHTEFLQLLNNPVEGNALEQDGHEMPHAVTVTPAEQAAIQRLEAMGFEKSLVIEAFLACDKNEEMAINYLLENSVDD